MHENRGAGSRTVDFPKFFGNSAQNQRCMLDRHAPGGVRGFFNTGKFTVLRIFRYLLQSKKTETSVVYLIVVYLTVALDLVLIRDKFRCTSNVPDGY